MVNPRIWHQRFRFRECLYQSFILVVFIIIGIYSEILIKNIINECESLKNQYSKGFPNFYIYFIIEIIPNPKKYKSYSIFR